MGTTGRREIEAAAGRYAKDEMDRDVRVTAVLDRGSSAMALCRAKDGAEDFALVLAAAIASHEWGVVDETDVDDFVRNALPEELIEREPEGDQTPPQCYACGEYSAIGTGSNLPTGWTRITVDLDPGDPEVGPQPNIADVEVCPKCSEKLEAKRS